MGVFKNVMKMKKMSSLIALLFLQTILCLISPLSEVNAVTSASENIDQQTKVVYEDYNKLKTLVDLGFFLENYIVEGGVVTKDVTYNNQIDVTEIVVSLDNDVTRRAAASFTTTIANTTYYLDYQSGDFKFATAHPSGYLPVAEVTTDSNKNVLVITDKRGAIGGVRFKYDVSYNGVSLSEAADLARKKGDLVKGSNIYGRAISDSFAIPYGALSRAREAVAVNKFLKVAFIGDSITEGFDIDSPQDAWVQQVASRLQGSLPADVHFEYFNFGIGGTGVFSASDASFVGGSGIFTQSWAVAGKTWYNHIKDYQPDLVIMAFGMNDADAGEIIEVDGYTNFINIMNSWPYHPDIALVSVCMPTSDAVLYGQKYIDGTMKVARAAREYARTNSIALADANRLFQILRDGIDDVSRTGAQETNWSNYLTNWTGRTDVYSLSGTTLTPTAGSSANFIARTRTFYNGTIELDVKPNGSTTNDAAWINYRDNVNQGTMRVLVYPGAGTAGSVGLYYSNSNTALDTASGLNIPAGSFTRIKIVVTGTNHKVYVGGALVLEFDTYLKLQNGNVSMGSGGGLNPTFSNLTITYEDPLSGTPAYTNDEIMGVYNGVGSGNGYNHPSGIGHSMAYAASFAGIIDALVNHSRGESFKSVAPRTYYVDSVNGNDLYTGLSSTTAFKTIQAAINRLPSRIDHSMTINVAAGSYSENVNITGFTGKGTLTIVGASSAADTHLIFGVYAAQNTIPVTVKGLKAVTTGDHALNINNNPGLLTLDSCKADGVTSTYSAAYVVNSNVYVKQSVLSNHAIGIYARVGTYLISETNSGTGNNFGLGSDSGATIVKISTQPGGTTAESPSSGGLIR